MSCPVILKIRTKTAAVFDDEEYFITGDAMKLVDPTDPNAGLKFDRAHQRRF